MPRTRRQPERRQQILEAATRTALTRGLFRIRLKDVAQLVNLTEGAVVYYFPSLQDLRLEVYRRAARSWFDARDAVVVEGNAPLEQLHALVSAAFRDEVPEGRLLGEPVMGVQVLPAFRAVAEAAFVREVARYQGILERGVALGDFELHGSTCDIACNVVSLEESYRLHMYADTIIGAAIGRRLVLSYLELSVRPHATLAPSETIVSAESTDGDASQ
jgi:AcrR family transcriptional regulator